MSKGTERFAREYTLLCGKTVARSIDPLVHKLCFAGSFRRMLPTCHDVDIVVIPRKGVRENQINHSLNKICVNKKLDNCGSGMSSGMVSPEDGLEPMPFQVFFTTEEKWGACLMYATGSRAYNIGYRSFAKKQYGLSVSEYGVKRNGKLIPDAGYSERAVCRAIHIPWKDPRERVDGDLFYR
jgi:DNA polymerase/3'-5' exonuclease PolX